MSIFNENGNYINLKDPLERMPYVMQEINMICNNYDYITEGGLDNIKNAIKKAWLKFKTFIVDALRSIKIKINDNTNKLLKYIEKNKTKVDEILKDKSIRNNNIMNIEFMLQSYNKFNLDEVKKDNEDKSNTELLAIIRGKLLNDNPINAEDFANSCYTSYKVMTGKEIITNSSVLIKSIKEYQSMIKSIDITIRTLEQTKILEALNKDPNLDFTNGVISIFTIYLSFIIKNINIGVRDIINAFNDKDNKSLYTKFVSDLPNIKDSTEEEQLDAVKNNPVYLKDIDNPSEKVQIAAVEINGNAIQFINNPSEDVQFIAVNNIATSIQYINNPSEKVQIAAVNKSGGCLKYINNPSEKVQIAAVNNDPYAIQYINNPSEAVQLAAVNKDPFMIYSIDNPSKKAMNLFYQITGIKNYTDNINSAFSNINASDIEKHNPGLTKEILDILR